jgi:hypothetical protein
MIILPTKSEQQKLQNATQWPSQRIMPIIALCMANKSPHASRDPKSPNFSSFLFRLLHVAGINDHSMLA